MKKPRRKRPGLPPPTARLRVAMNDLDVGFTSRGILVTSLHMLGGEEIARELDLALAMLAKKHGCEVRDLRLDHDPMLRVRGYRPRAGQPVASWYTPHAHDAKFLKWRPQPPQFDGSHHVKTYVRGERGQLSDTALAKRERRRERNPTKWTSLRSLKKPKKSRPKRKGVSRPIRSRGFPPAGSRTGRRSWLRV